MSKIYESLLRAELERLQSGAAAGSAKESDALAQQAEKDLANLKTVAVKAASAQSGTEPGKPASPGSAQAPAAFPFEKIAIRPWRPVMSQLPSLRRTTPAAEQFRSLRARLYEYRDFSRLKTVLVSSGMPQEGKSFVAVNLAAVLAHQRGSKVLLIDADLRRYSLNKVLGCEPEPGLADYLSGKAEPVDVMQRAVLPDATDKLTAPLANLTFIPAGCGGDSVADLGTQGRFQQLIDRVRNAFDWIIVDSSPVNLVSDAVHFAHDCDGVLLVVRSGTTRYQIAQRAQAEFKKGSVIGVVLNGSTDAPAAGYYGYGNESNER
jgi:capsular exopolysaccharide synthesis family protein